MESHNRKRGIVVMLFLLHMRRRRNRTLMMQQSKKRAWARKWLLRRELYGQYDTLMQELAAEDERGYVSFQRVCPDIFRELLDKVGPLIAKKDTTFRQAIPPEVRLAITLRFLATGQTYMSSMYNFRVASNTIGKIVPETCKALYDVLSPEFLKAPATQEEWSLIAKEFHEKWQFPNCVGAIDGKHITLRAPHNSGSLFMALQM